MYERILNIINHFHDGKIIVFANKVGIKQGNVSDWKSGKSQPSVKAIIKIHKVYNVCFDWLILGVGPMFDHEYNPSNAPETATVQESTPSYITQDDQIILDLLRQAPDTRKTIIRFLHAYIEKGKATTEMKSLLNDMGKK